MSTPTKTRIEVIDALRGFALAGILICHMVEQYVGAGTPASHFEGVRTGLPDQIVEGLIAFFLRGKFLALFSFLFGISFFIQMDNGAKRGAQFGPRFLWRLLLLLGIGYLHSLFCRGDILTVYAILGVFLIPFFKIDNKWILGGAAVLFLGLGRYIAFFLTNGQHLFLDINPTDMESAHVLNYYNTIKSGSLWDVFRTNGWEGHLDKMNFQFGVFGRAYYTFAFFLIGLYAGRSGFFKHFREKKMNTKRIWLGSVMLFFSGAGIAAAAFISNGQEGGFNTWLVMIGLSGLDLVNLAMTLMYILLFVKLFQKLRLRKWLSGFAPYGRMALTNYILQSIFGTLLFYGWGFGNLSEISNVIALLIALVFIIFQIWVSKIWLQYFRYGPLEWIWRSLTFFKYFPIRNGD